MQRQLTTFPIPQHVRFKLCSSGFTTVEDLQNIGPVALSQETQLTKEEAVEVLELIFLENAAASSSKCDALGASALDILLEEKSKPPIPTFCHALDQMLGGGIPLKKVTEVCGAPGSGKTQMCLQLCTNVQIPAACSGLQGEALFIDTEGSFVIDRLVQIASSTVNTCQKIIKATNPAVTEPFTLKAILESVYYFHCKSYTELIARINLIPEFLKTHPKVCLLIIDSISFHFRYGFEESYALRTRLLNGLSQSLVKIANEFGMAVIVTNQMTTRLQKQNEGRLVPSLGESWGHACTVRVILSWNEGKRQAFLFKSPWKEEATASYQITASGIRDISLVQEEEKSSLTAGQGLPPYKKAKTSF